MKPSVLLGGQKPSLTVQFTLAFILQMMAAVAALCVQYEADFRPNMTIVVKALQPLYNAKPAGSNLKLLIKLHGRKGVQGAEPGPVLSWTQRVRIAYGAARGLEYLHEKGGSLGSFSPDISRLLQLCDEDDDGVTSGLAAPKPDPDAHSISPNSIVNNANFVVTPVSQEHEFKLLDQYKDSHLGITTAGGQNTGVDNQFDYFSFNSPPEFEPNSIGGIYGVWGEDGLPQVTSFLSNICPPPSAFLGPKCALWDCPRPAQGWWPERPVQWWCTSYCSSLHAVVAQNEGQPGMTPVIRPKGIELKDNLLFDALSAKAQGKNVGVPVCEGAATAKSPWNAPELFDLSVFEGEMLREWLFFDKPRRAFESGNRKQRSLPDYNGRGWHESRKQVINESGWLKRSYYMDPQPMKLVEWHLYEYEINKYDACALYRLELKLVDRKKNPRGKISSIHTSRYLNRPLVI